ncbi:MAG: DMT family transporter [Caulobacteraceae bacterium]|nr:DMT family transporter [Caulobacteraceae bacterium]
MQPTSDRRALAVLIFGACMIGFGPVLVRIARAEHVDPAGSAFWRVTLALPILVAMMLRGRAANGAGARIGPSWITAIAGFLFAGDLVCWHYGIRFTSIANATVLSNMTPVIVTTAAWLMFRQTPRPVFLVGMALAIGGSTLMALAKGGSGANPHLGDVLSAGAAVWYAGYMLLVREARQTTSASVVMFWSSLIASPFLLAFALAMGERIWPSSALGWTVLIGLGVMHVAGQGSIAWALGRLPAPLAAVTILVQPIVAAVAGWAVFAEHLSWMQALGAAIALGGVALARAAGRGEAQPPPAGATLEQG